MTIKYYRDLEVWQIGMSVAQSVYAISRRFPFHERLALGSQMQRAAVSIPSNIAEGHSRAHLKEYLKHIGIAIGSLAELETQLELSVDLGYTSQTETEKLFSNLKLLGRKLYSLRDSLSEHLP